MRDCTRCPLSCKIMGEPLELENNGPLLMIFEIPLREENINGEYISVFYRELFEKYNVDIDSFSKTSLLKCYSEKFLPDSFEKCRFLLWKDILAVQPKKIYCWGHRVATKMRIGAHLKKTFSVSKHFFETENVVIGTVVTSLVYLPSPNKLIMNRVLCEQTMEFLKNESKYK